jgi:hypothetical protein
MWPMCGHICYNPGNHPTGLGTKGCMQLQTLPHCSNNLRSSAAVIPVCSLCVFVRATSGPHALLNKTCGPCCVVVIPAIRYSQSRFLHTVCVRVIFFSACNPLVVPISACGSCAGLICCAVPHCRLGRPQYHPRKASRLTLGIRACLAVGWGMAWQVGCPQCPRTQKEAQLALCGSCLRVRTWRPASPCGWVRHFNLEGLCEGLFWGS